MTVPEIHPATDETALSDTQRRYRRFVFGQATAGAEGKSEGIRRYRIPLGALTIDATEVQFDSNRWPSRAIAEGDSIGFYDPKNSVPIFSVAHSIDHITNPGGRFLREAADGRIKILGADEADTYINSLVSQLERLKGIGQMTLLDSLDSGQQGVRVSLVH